MDKRRRAQIRMAETIAVLTIFFFLLVFGFGFYMKLTKDWVERQSDKNVNLRALQISQKAAYMPEFQCSIQNIQDDNCFDILKVRIFGSRINESDELKERYFEELGFSKLVLEQIYPKNPPDDEWVLYNRLLNESQGTITSIIPVSIYDGEERQYSIGILHITVSKPK